MSLYRGFITVGGLTALSRVFGLLREMLLAAVMGAGWVADAFFVSFRFPNLFRALFAEGAGKVTLATIHKAKGLEAKRVFWLNSSDCPSKWARQEWQVQQEMNLCYVATTRAQEELVLIEAPKKARPRS